MKKYCLSVLMLFLGLVLVSWGPTGHEAVAKIAQNHLTPKTRAAVEELLAGQTMPQVSIYADQVRTDATEGLHFINLPTGLDFDTFVKTIMAMKTPNAYSAIITLERKLASPKMSKEEKAVDLKYLIHIVGDIHQPMHVSHAGDRGGNTINVIFNGKPTNLHSLWDSGLFAENNLNYTQIAQSADNATSEQIKQWQADAPITWAWESYQLSEQLYAEAAKKPYFDNTYYQKYMPVVRQRLLQGGIRLAGLLNQIFDAGNN